MDKMENLCVAVGSGSLIVRILILTLALLALVACESPPPTPTPAPLAPIPAVTPTAAPVAGPTATPPPGAAQKVAPGPTATPTPGLPDVDVEKAFHGYFDIANGSGPGSEVVGRINLERNRNVASSPIPDDYEFVIIEDDSGGMFQLRNERDSDGRLFGVFSVASGKAARTGNYPLRVELLQGSTVMARFTAPVTVAAQTQWDIYYDKVVNFVGSHSRLTGRRNYSDAEVTALVAELEANNGAFTGMSFYNAATRTAWLNIGAAALGDDLEEAAQRIGGMGKAYLESHTYGPSVQDADRGRLRNAIYLALIAYVDHFPLDDFANSEALSRADRIHQWRFTDPISGAAVLIYRDLVADLHNDAQRASDTKERLFHLLQRVNFDLPEAWRMPAHSRYYLPHRLAESSGA